MRMHCAVNDCFQQVHVPAAAAPTHIPRRSAAATHSTTTTSLKAAATQQRQAPTRIHSISAQRYRTSQVTPRELPWEAAAPASPSSPPGGHTPPHTPQPTTTRQEPQNRHARPASWTPPHTQRQFTPAHTRGPNGSSGRGYPVPDPRLLTKWISSSVTPSQLHQLCALYAPHLNFIHASAALVALAKMADAAGGLHQPPSPAAAPSSRPAASPQLPGLPECAQLVIALVRQQQQQLQPRAVANCLWAATKLASLLPASTTSSTSPHRTAGALAPGPPVREQCLELALLLLGKVPAALPSFQPQHVSNTAYAMASLYSMAPSSSPLSPGLPTAPHPSSNGSQQQQQVASTVSHEGEEATFEQLLNSCLVARGQPPLELQGLLQALLQHSWGLLPDMSPQAIANLLYSLAVLRHAPDEGWLSDVLDAAQLMLVRFEPRHVSTSLWALAKMGYHPGDEWLRDVLAAAALKLPLCSPQALANIVWALAKLGYTEDPHLPQHSMTRLLQELLVQAPVFGAQDCANSLWALATLHRLAAAAAAGGQEQAEAGGGRQGTAGAGARAPAAGLWLQCCSALLRRACDCRSAASPQELCNILWAASVMLPSAPRGRPPSTAAGPAEQRPPPGADHGRLDLILQRLQQLLHQCNAQELSNAALACARLGLPSASRRPGDAAEPVHDEGWWSSFWAASLRLLPTAEPQHLANMLWSAQAAAAAAAAQQQLVPGVDPLWLDAVLRRVSGSGSALGPGTLTTVLCCLPRLRVRPSLPALLPVLQLAECAAAGGGGPALGAAALARVLWSFCWLTQGSMEPKVERRQQQQQQQQQHARLLPWEVQSSRLQEPAHSPPAPPDPTAAALQPLGPASASEPAAQQQLLQRVSASLVSRFLSPVNVAASTAQELSVGSLALVVLKARPPGGAVQRLAAALGKHVPGMQLRELGVLLVALPSLGHIPSPALLSAARARLDDLVVQQGEARGWAEPGMGPGGGAVRAKLQALQHWHDHKRKELGSEAAKQLLAATLVLLLSRQHSQAVAGSLREVIRMLEQANRAAAERHRAQQQGVVT